MLVKSPRSLSNCPPGQWPSATRTAADASSSLAGNTRRREEKGMAMHLLGHRAGDSWYQIIHCLGQEKIYMKMHVSHPSLISYTGRESAEPAG